MSMPSIFFTAPLFEAKEFRLNHDLPDEDVFQCGGMDSLKISMLRAFLNDVTWDVKMMDDFAKIASQGEEWTWQLPSDLVATLAALDKPQILEAATAWAATEEMDCDPKDILFLVDGMKRITLRSLHTEQPMFLYLSL